MIAHVEIPTAACACDECPACGSTLARRRSFPAAGEEPNLCVECGAEWSCPVHDLDDCEGVAA